MNYEKALDEAYTKIHRLEKENEALRKETKCPHCPSVIGLGGHCICEGSRTIVGAYSSLRKIYKDLELETQALRSRVQALTVLLKPEEGKTN